MTPVARRLGTTCGQAWTLSLGLGLGALLLGSSLPPVLDQRDAPVALAAAPPPAPALDPLLEAAVPADPPAPAAPPVPLPEPATLLLPPALALPAEPAPQRAAQPAPQAPRAEPARPAAPPPAAVPAEVPLTVREAGFSTTAATAAPSGGVPVGALLGAEREQAYVRLAGNAADLVLALSDDPRATTNRADAAVRACPITDPAWRPQRPGPRVPFDATRCVPGELRGDGTVRFPLAAYPDRAGPAGFALVVDPEAPPAPAPRTFRLTFLVPETPS